LVERCAGNAAEVADSNQIWDKIILLTLLTVTMLMDYEKDAMTSLLPFSNMSIAKNVSEDVIVSLPSIIP